MSPDWCIEWKIGKRARDHGPSHLHPVWAEIGGPGRSSCVKVAPHSLAHAKINALAQTRSTTYPAQGRQFDKIRYIMTMIYI